MMIAEDLEGSNPLWMFRQIEKEFPALSRRELARRYASSHLSRFRSPGDERLNREDSRWRSLVENFLSDFKRYGQTPDGRLPPRIRSRAESYLAFLQATNEYKRKYGQTVPEVARGLLNDEILKAVMSATDDLVK